MGLCEKARARGMAIVVVIIIILTAMAMVMVSIMVISSAIVKLIVIGRAGMIIREMLSVTF